MASIPNLPSHYTQRNYQSSRYENRHSARHKRSYYLKSWGRQLDTTLSSADALKLARDTVDEKMEIILDESVRKGIDILKALALGAKAVMVGRPILWGLATGGEEGIKQVLNILKSELDIAMSLCKYTSIAEINEEVLFSPFGQRYLFPQTTKHTPVVNEALRSRRG